MDKPFNLEDVVEQWQVDYLRPAKAKESGAAYYQLPIEQRKELFVILVSIIKEAGKQEDFFVNSRIDDIVEQTIPKKSRKNKNSFEDTTPIWREATRKALRFAIKEVYSKKNTLKLVESKPTENASKQPIEAPKKPIIKEFDPSKYTDDKYKEPPILDVLDEDIAKLLGLKDENE